jgi:glutamyl endopeptidase
MTVFDDKLPLGQADFRKFASQIAQSSDIADQARAAAGTILRTRAIVWGPRTVHTEHSHEADRLIQLGIEAARTLSAAPGTPLTADHEIGYEAVIRLTERPALIIRDDRFAAPPSRWQHLDHPFRKDIEQLIPSVGRIDTTLDGGRQMVGTGFVVSSDLIMTNTHVVEEFADPAPDFSNWSIKVGADPTIDFKAEHEIPKRKAFRIKEVVTAYDRSDPERLKSLDLALLRLERLSSDPPGERLPEPVRLAAQEPITLEGGSAENEHPKDLYLVGYPWTDNEGVTPPSVLADIFGGIVKMKRLQPGEYGANFASHLTFSHDSSTLGGNSGSFVANLSSGSIIGLHFRGKYRQNNYALQLWKLRDVAGIKDKGLNFTA